MDYGRRRTCSSTGASLSSNAGVFAVPGYAPSINVAWVQLTDLPRLKLRSFNQEILQDSMTGEISKHVVKPSQDSSCVSLIQKQSFPPPEL